MYAKMVAESIEKALKERGISKGQFYKESGISSATFSNWKREVYTPSSEQIKKVEAYLGLNFELKETTQEEKAKNEATDEELKFALFGTADITDELYAEVKRYAAYALEQEKFKKFSQKKE